MHNRFLICLLVLISCGCASQLYQPSPASLQRARRMDPDLQLGDLQAARSLYVSRCSSCHRLHLPSEYTARQWVRILKAMQPKAKLSDAQSKQLLIYLSSE